MNYINPVNKIMVKEKSELSAFFIIISFSWIQGLLVIEHVRALSKRL